MSKEICIFKRIEKKYRLTQQQKDSLIKLIGDYLTPDSHGKSTICSLYLDTPDFLMIRNSIEAKEESKAYKEKLRLRSYGTPNAETKVFLEIKKKYKGVVYKRRVSMSLENAEIYIDSGLKPFDSQIMSEIDYTMNFYNHPKPSMLIAYEREAYYVKALPNLRLTFDSSVRYRETDLSLENGTEGTKIIPDGTFLLEIKTDGAMPLWLSHALDQCSIRPVSFSKYGTAYRETFNQKHYLTKGEFKYVSNF